MITVALPFSTQPDAAPQMRSTRLSWKASFVAACFEICRCDRRIGSSILLVTIIHATPREAVMPSSLTMSMGMSMITAKPSTFVSSANVPGMKSRANARLAAVRLSTPATTSRSHVFDICTACDTPMEKMRKGTRIESGSMP